ncbi:EamA family transporter [Peribacillus frigoritolerans]|jgi:drug/metabolite transporter (DMT)-like permease|uniref:EamA family transporter n=1 Tax=Peribacillus frigoritolerans TaxID=450367 RepID=UPI00227E90E6|nr:EamA family transporter [Peribacillus frigoritolerans]MCY9002375.1 EamA family transporter [Peribacillus frigoritolerans]MED4632291.1 EamA family transporter [Peribacillus frigoritolerans]
MSVFSNVATLITIVAGVLFLQEAFHLYHLIGGIMIIIGVVGENFNLVKDLKSFQQKKKQKWDVLMN